MSDVAFKPDSGNPLYEIKIIVFENTQSITITPLNGEQPTYQSVVGSLEIHKINMILKQTSINFRHYIDALDEKDRVFSKKESENINTELNKE